MLSRQRLPEVVVACCLLLWGSATAAAEPIDFGRDVLPLLSDRCFHCHGPDASVREAELRLDESASVFAERAEGAVVVPHQPAKSQLMARVTAADPDLRMPPSDSHVKPLTAAEVDILRRWIAGGADWSRHWAFTPPARPPLPRPQEHPIDAFVQQRLQQEGLSLSPPAPRHTLLRRLSLDLRGLPPTISELQDFLQQDTATAYAQAIERMLASPHYAERMAMWWLDVARYADTDGYQGDATRMNWPWRDWVVEAFRQNMPFDQFTLEQFAGDLLPAPTDDQMLATCFHRNHMTNGEGGRHPEESRIDYVIDRVNTTGTVWLGLTLGCAQCHAHKFDPISQQDYYRLFAFFNSVDEDGRAGNQAKPYFKYQSPYAARAVNEMQRWVDHVAQREATARQAAEQAFAPWLAERIEQTRDGFQSWHVLQPAELTTSEGTKLTVEDQGIVQASGRNPLQDDYRVVARPPVSRLTGVRLEVFPHASHTDGKLSRGARGEFILTNFKVSLRRAGSSQLQDLEFDSAIADVEKDVSGRNYGKIQDTLDDDPRNGWTTEGHASAEPHTGVFALAEPLPLSGDEELVVVMLHRSTRGDANLGRFRLSVTDQPGSAVRQLQPMPLAALAATAVQSADEVPDGLRQRLLDQFLLDHREYALAKNQLESAQRQLAEVQKASEQLDVMVLGDRAEPRKTFVLQRGVWDQPGDEVQPGVPAAVLARPGPPMQTRLDLADWLIDRNHPLTARVIVNHLWSMLFGVGLVRTPEDFGLQGERPTHPQLLDWLAVELMDHDWDLQHVLRLMVTSKTYQQTSVAAPDLRQRDPQNRLLARSERYRLPSWMIRDGALQVSGLLNAAVGGPPVRPFQPAGVWTEIFMGRFRYEPSSGPAQYRRTLYAFWRRSSAPTFLFDAAQRRVCEVHRRRTNTPLQALTLLNDKTQLVAAAALAKMVTREVHTLEDGIRLLYRRVLSRNPTDEELAIVGERWNAAADHYHTHPQHARELVGPHLSAAEMPAVSELAAAMVTASMLLNLDETITRE